ncbi:MAG: hypothetical protein M3O46_17125 [Myxococcota bacterium]|nr:hypothetical protein [Myxococcota bacterium]
MSSGVSWVEKGLASLNRIHDKSGQTRTDPVEAQASLVANPRTTQRIPNGPSVPPVTLPAAEVLAARRMPVGALQPVENSEEMADETTSSQLPRWFGAVALAAGATLLFLLILLAPSDGGSKFTPAAQPAAQSAVSIVAQPQASPVPRATLEPLDPPVALGFEPQPAPKPEQPAPMSPPRTQIGAGPLPSSTANPNGSASPARMPSLPVAPTPRTYLPDDPMARGIHSTGSSTVQSQAAPVRGHVDNSTRTTPLRPIETRDPYQSP